MYLKKSGGGIPGRRFHVNEARQLYYSFEKSIDAVKAALRFPTRLGTTWPAQPHRIHIITREGLLGSGLDPDMLLPGVTFNSAYRAAQAARGRRV